MIRVLYVGFCIMLSGCGRPLMTLKALGESQGSMQRQVGRQEAKFDLLASDIKNGKIARGMPRERFINIYGEPVLEGRHEGGLRLLYRYPLEFFNTGKIYVYFDKDGLLSDWSRKEAGAAGSPQ
ncbi:MAG: hypothetical protein PHR44_07790 [Candidatus Omnitrophica bacterium]|nr:hypothetical protein [Candidatus Omnitrophota bacterium]